MGRGIGAGILCALLSCAVGFAAPPAAMAANGVAETAVTTYTVNTAKSEIDVTASLSIKNLIPSKVESCGVLCTNTTNYYITDAFITVPTQAGAVSATSDGGAVKQTPDISSGITRSLKLTFPKLWYGQTRKVTATYAIPAGAGASGGFRALKAYAALCAWGNDSSTGADSQAVNVLVPDGFAVSVTGGLALNMSGDKNGVQTYTSGSVPTGKGTYTCLQASNPSGLVSTTGQVGNSSFTIRSWPEDTAWAATLAGYIRNDVPKLQSLSGLPFPDGVTIVEAGNQELGGYGATYLWQTKTATMTEGSGEAMTVRELASILYSPLFADFWISDGFAQFSKKILGPAAYTPCSDPGRYPGTGSPSLTAWKQLEPNSTATDVAESNWQYAASCYLVTKLADTIGPDKLKTVLNYASARAVAYSGPVPEIYADRTSPVSARQLLDLIDEIGMLPAGVQDLDEAQNLLSGYGIFTASDLQSRSQARAAYHGLAKSAGTWKLPVAITRPMAEWDFGTARTRIATATQIIAARDQAIKNIPDLTLDETPLQTQFESAKTQADLEALLALTKSEADAAGKVGQAEALNGGGHGVLQTIGLIGADLATPLQAARDALRNAKPDEASVSAQRATDTLNGSSNQGLIRLAALAILVLVVLLLAVFLRRRRMGVPALAHVDVPTSTLPMWPTGQMAEASVSVPQEATLEEGWLDPAPIAAFQPPQNVTVPRPGSLAERLRELEEARAAGLISEVEFIEARARLLGGV